MENYPSRLKIKLHLKSKALLVSSKPYNNPLQKIDDLNKENLKFKKAILNNIKLKSKMKFSLTKKLPTQTEESSKQKEKEKDKEKNYTSNIVIASIPTIKKQIMRNNTGIKKIPSSSYTSSLSMTKIKLTNTINYSIKEENEKINRPKIFKERN